MVSTTRAVDAALQDWMLACWEITFSRESLPVGFRLSVDSAAALLAWRTLRMPGSLRSRNADIHGRNVRGGGARHRDCHGMVEHNLALSE